MPYMSYKNRFPLSWSEFLQYEIWPPFLKSLFFFLSCKENVFLRFHVLYPFNMMRYRAAVQVRSWADSQAKPFADQQSTWNPKDDCDESSTSFSALMNVFV